MATAKKYSVCIVGSGNWGSAIARIIGENVKKSDLFEERVAMWVFEEMIGDRKLTDVINNDHENVKYLPGFKIPENVVAIPDAAKAAEGANIFIFVLPHQFVEGVCKQIKGHVTKDALAISLIKGVDSKGTGLVLTSSVIEEALGISECCVLMGANLANEVAAENFCEATIGYKNAEHGKILQTLFHTSYFRIAICSDCQTVELCGALKNVVAVGAGICDGLGYGGNTKAAVIRIGLKEMVSFAKEFFGGGHDATFLESCGVADLVTTCYGGRNRKVAEALAKTRKSIEQLEAELLNGQKVQGPPTSIEVYKLLQTKGTVDQYPLFSTVYRICYEGLPPEDLVKNI
ncbi:glycerol-3-phosphate dehydrogenase [NAD(+)], cytoplasmic-like isoform X2 [Oscarella lobularis]|uniref:glycerol-3-phosphate dehydrogenase [NAD(+)], cytoplasmic-like isoform X2 n=1 Tax=Oscarella lobularis TaxID=121494 RepID=UPI0033132536